MLGMIIGIVAIVYAAMAVLSVAFVVFATLWTVFSGAVATLGVTISLKGIIIGTIIGYLAVRYLRNRNMVQNG